MKRLRISLSLLILTLVMAMPAMAADYDLVINNGRVMDPETMFDDVANVGITKRSHRCHQQAATLGQGNHRRHRACGSTRFH